MGAVRFVLASIVLAFHAGFGSRTVGGLGSVEAFFVLSGTYMAAVYQTKYSLISDGIRQFYFNRLLRLWPIYIFSVVLTLAAYLGLGHPLESGTHFFDIFSDIERTGIDTVHVFVLVLSVILVGQDFSSVNEHVQLLLPVRQSWSIASEILFYLAVPLAFRQLSWKILFSGFAVLMGLKYILLTMLSWRYSYFLPIGNFGYFLLGGAIYDLSRKQQMEQFKEKFGVLRLPLTGLLVIFLLSFGEASFERGGVVHHLVFIFVFSGATALLFQKSVNKTDNFLGNISYGIYLNHFTVIAVGTLLGFAGRPLLLFALACSISLSFLTDLLIQVPIDRYRRGRTGAVPARA